MFSWSPSHSPTLLLVSLASFLSPLYDVLLNRISCLSGRLIGTSGFSVLSCSDRLCLLYIAVLLGFPLFLVWCNLIGFELLSFRYRFRIQVRMIAWSIPFPVLLLFALYFSQPCILRLTSSLDGLSIAWNCIPVCLLAVWIGRRLSVSCYLLSDID